MDSKPWENCRDGLKLFVKLAPKAGADRLIGLYESADDRLRLKVAVTAAPEKGKANAALVALMAKQLGVAKSRVQIEGGATHREKTLRFEGDPKELAERFRALLASL